MNIHPLIQKYLSGNCSENERLALLDWVHQSVENAQLFEEYKKLWELSLDVDDTIVVNTPEALAKFKSNLVLANAGEVKRMKPTLLLRVAAGLCFLIFSAIAFRYYQHSLATEKFATKYIDNQAPILLMDGSIVNLNKQTVLLASNNFNKNERKLRLDGEAFFTVQPNANKPFIIELPYDHSSIRVVGTQFNVLAYSHSAKTEVSVIEGQVEFIKDSRQYKLVAGDKLIMDNEAMTIEIMRDENSNARSWLTKNLSFRNAPLDKVVADINQAYNVDLRLASPCLATYRFTSTLDMNSYHHAKDIIEILAVTFHLRLIEGPNEKYTLQGACK